MKRPLLLGLLLLALVRPVRADIIELDDGRKIEGEILSETDDEVEIKIPYGATKFPRSRIVKITKKASPEQEFRDRRAKLDAKDVKGRIELARWVLEHHFPREKAAELSVEAWRIEPGNDGSIELLATKLDYHYEQDAWLDAEHWYPQHGYVRKGGSFITTEEAAYEDALALVTKLKAALAAADLDLKNAQDAVTQAPERLKKIKKDLDDLKADQATATSKKQTAKATVDARDNDVKNATQRTLQARTDLAIAQGAAGGNGGNGGGNGNGGGGGGNNNNKDLIALAQANLNQAVLDEDKARKALDAAQKDLDRVSAELDKITGKIPQVQSALDNFDNMVKQLEASIPERKKLRDDAAAHLTQADSASKDAKKAVDDRKARDLKDAAARIDELKAMKKKQ
jgi:hypothetical protein